jgi:hypothetical protein
MDKTILVGLGGQPTQYRLDEAAYGRLSGYLDRARRRLQDDPDQAEVLADLERSVGERLAAVVGSEDRSVTAVEMDGVLEEIGAVDTGTEAEPPVDETRPRNQGASLTAFELGAHGVPHTIIADNAGGHYMQAGRVDLCIVGTDRVTAHGDVANKIGTYLKALAARDNDVPFYVALPHSTIDWTLDDGSDIPIEERAADEVLKMSGRLEDGEVVTVEIAAPGSPAANPAFDVTPARLVTAFITERGIAPASGQGLRTLYPAAVL